MQTIIVQTVVLKIDFFFVNDGNEIYQNDCFNYDYNIDITWFSKVRLFRKLIANVYLIFVCVIHKSDLAMLRIT